MIDNITCYKQVLSNKTFLFKIGDFRIGGAERAAFILAKALKELIGAKVVFLVDKADGPMKKWLDDLHITYYSITYRLKGSKFQRIIDSAKLIYFIRSKIKPFYLLPYISDNCKIILPFWKLTGAKYAWWMMQDEGRGLCKTKFEKLLLESSSEIVSNSVVGRDFISANYGIPKNRILLYNNAVTIPEMNKIKPCWRKDLGIDDNAIMVSMIANITEFKDHVTLLKAWRIVQDYFHNKNRVALLLLAGRPGKTINELKILGFDLGISHSVRFLGPILNTVELMFESDLIAHSSNIEGCPNAVCEAMALGKAVVATDISGDREVLSDKYESYCLSQPNVPNDLAQKIIFLIENPDLRIQIGLYNKQRIEDHYSIDHMLSTILHSFEKAVRHR